MIEAGSPAVTSYRAVMYVYKIQTLMIIKPRQYLLDIIIHQNSVLSIIYTWHVVVYTFISTSAPYNTQNISLKLCLLIILTAADAAAYLSVHHHYQHLIPPPRKTL